CSPAAPPPAFSLAYRIRSPPTSVPFSVPCVNSAACAKTQHWSSPCALPASPLCPAPSPPTPKPPKPRLPPNWLRSLKMPSPLPRPPPKPPNRRTPAQSSMDLAAVAPHDPLKQTDLTACPLLERMNTPL